MIIRNRTSPGNSTPNFAQWTPDQSQSASRRASQDQGVMSGPTPEEWARFEKMDWRFPRRLFIGILVCLLPSLILGFFLAHVGGFVLAVLSFFAVELVGLLIAYTNSRGEEWQRHKIRQTPDQPRRVTLSKNGIWLAGIYFLLKTLEEVTLLREPPVLHFRYTEAAGENGDATNTYTLPLLIPLGYENEAPPLAERFRAEVIEEYKRMMDRYLYPPEPGR
jgi:hypothetical protein